MNKKEKANVWRGLGQLLSFIIVLTIYRKDKVVD